MKMTFGDVVFMNLGAVIIGVLVLVFMKVVG